MIALALIMTIIAAGAIVGALFIFRRQISASVGVERDSLASEIPKILDEAKGLLEQADRFASRPQLDFVIEQVQAAQAGLDNEKSNLKNIETRLEQAQKDVETKEASQQELKSSKEEDENQLQELLARAETIASEALALEQRLAASMKNLDQLLQEVDLTPDQRGMLEELQRAFTDASSRLRDLLMEYNTVKDRLMVLKQQHKDLEEEYTRLVEQQLGE